MAHVDDLPMSRPPKVSPAHILAVAAEEFSAKGYDGATVDRIARRARVNKAMLYYHFRSKRAIYRALLTTLFSAAASRLQAIADSHATPEAKLTRFVEALGDILKEHPHIPALWMREVADGGRHLDRDTLAGLAAIPAVLGRIVRAGQTDGAFRQVHPMAVYFTLAPPLMLFFGGAPILKALAAHKLAPTGDLTAALFTTHLQHTLRASLDPRTSPGS